MVFLRPSRSHAVTFRMSTTPTHRTPWHRWLFPIALAAMIVIASGRGQVAGPDIVNFDKLAHFSIFGLLATLVVRAPGMKHAWIAVFVVSLFGISDEIRQSFTPGRSVAFADWVADTSGACVAVVAYTFWQGYRRLLEWRLFSPRRARPASTPPADGENAAASVAPAAEASAPSA